MKNPFSEIGSNIGSKIKCVFLAIYVISCIAAFVSAIAGYIWCLSTDFVWLGIVYIVGGILAPFVLYPAFMLAYGYGIIVQNMEKGLKPSENTEVEEIKKSGSAFGVYIVTCIVVLAVAVVICSGIFISRVTQTSINEANKGEVYNPDTYASDTLPSVDTANDTTSFYDN